MKNISLKSPSKLNLTLEILKKFHDNFHEIRSLVLNMDLCDEIRLEKSEDFEIKTDSDIAQNENLIYKGYQILLAKFGDLPTKVHLKKNIPLDAGLGGGSGNAANFLFGMNELWDLNLDFSDFKSIGNNLGMDVNMFFKPGINLLKGKGNETENVDALPHGAILIFHDGLRIPKKTFRAYNMIKVSEFSSGENTNQLINCIAGRSFGLGSIKCFNVFDNYINDLYPEASDFKAFLNKQIDNEIYLSGSGSSLFCLFDDVQKAKHVYENIDVKHYKKFLAFPWRK